MKKLLTFLGVVAVAVVGGLTIPEAVDTELDKQGYTCEQLGKGFALLAETETPFYLVLADGLRPPTAYGGMVIGDCSQGECRIESPKCGALYSWPYTKTASVNGRSLYKLRPPLAFAKALRSWAGETPGAIWLGESVKAMEALRERYPAVTAQLFAQLNDHWASRATVPHKFFKDRQVRPVCIGGLLYTVGVGGSEPCDGAASDWVPFEPGKHGAQESAQREITETELTEAAKTAVSVEAVR